MNGADKINGLPFSMNRRLNCFAPEDICEPSKNKAKLIGRRYQLGEKIGEGGIGCVYEAFDQELNRTVAIKILKKEVVEDVDEVDEVNRFYYEAEILAQMDHPGIIPIFGTGYDETHGVYFIMKYVKGRSFDNLLLSKTPKDPPSCQLLNMFENICDTVAYAHKRGLVHRDLKPENIMVDKFGVIYVMDWGLAKRIVGRTDLDDKLVDTTTGIIKGSPLYMSPEHTSGDMAIIDFRSDVFSLGIILYEILTGETPFDANEFNIVMIKLKTVTVKPPHSINPNVDPLLEAICMKALAKNPLDRYQTAGELANDWRKYLIGQVPDAYSPSRAFCLKQWISQYPRMFSIIATLLSVAMAIILFFAFNWQISKSEISGLKKEISLQRNFVNSISQRRLTLKTRLTDGNIDKKIMEKIRRELKELESVETLVHSNLWNLTSHVLRFYSSPENQLLKSWREDKQCFLEDSIMHELDSPFLKANPYAAHLLLSAVLSGQIDNQTPTSPMLTKSCSEHFTSELKKLESMIKNQYGADNPPDWSKYLEGLKIPQ